MDKDQWIDYRELQRAGWAVQKTNQIRLNGGSESKDHVAAKALVAHIGHNAGYRVSSEVVHRYPAARPCRPDYASRRV